MLHARTTWLFLIITLPAIAGLSRADDAGAIQTFSSSRFRYSVQFPTKWQKAADSEVQQRAAVLRNQPATRTPVWEAIFAPPSNRPSMGPAFPYVICQVTPYPDGKHPTESDISATVKALTGNDFKNIEGVTNQQIKDVLSTTALKDNQYDGKTHTLYQTMEMSAKGEGAVRMLVVSHFGNDALVSIMCYERPEKFDAIKADFDQIEASFKFDPGSEYVPSRAALYGLGGMVGIGAVIVVIVIVMNAAKKSKPSVPPPMNPYFR